MRTLRSSFFALALLALTGGSFGCEGAGHGSGAPEAVRSTKSRIEAPLVSDEDRRALAADNAAFGFDLYGQLAAKPGNVFCSPFSISSALAMTYAGARGDTATEMAAALHFGLPAERLHAAFNAVDLALASRAEAASSDARPFQLHVANALWGQRGYPFLPEFLDVLAENYGAGMNVLDFATAPEPARETINAWVEDETEGRIEDLLKPGMIDELTRLVLTNAIYFDAAWAQPFEADATEDRPFTLLDGTEVQVPTMHQTADFAYAEGDGYEALALPYDGGALEMVVLLPAAGRFAEIEAALGPELLADIDAAWLPGEVQVALPKFSFSSDFGLKGALEALGMEKAFGMECDLTAMAGTAELYIADVVHKAFVAVDEEGTEAAAATAVIVAGRGLPPDTTVFRADRPFLFLVRDVPTGTVLFLGRTVDPR